MFNPFFSHIFGQVVKTRFKKTFPNSIFLSPQKKKQASEYFTDSPDQLNEPVQHFAQVAPPRNVTVQQTDVGDEFVVSWYPPEYGIETLRVYVVRWYREPGHHLIGTAETRDTYYKGIFFYSLPFSLPIYLEHIHHCY